MGNSKLFNDHLNRHDGDTTSAEVTGRSGNTRGSDRAGHASRRPRRDMLHAHKAALHNRVRVRLQGIRELELRLYVRNCNLLSTLSAIHAGGAFFGIIYRAMPTHGLGGHTAQIGSPAEALYLVLLTLTMGLSIQCTLIASLTAMLGPGLALRGPDGSVRAMPRLVRVTDSCACGTRKHAHAQNAIARPSAPVGAAARARCAPLQVPLAVESMRTFYSLALALELLALASLLLTAIAFTWANQLSLSGRLLAFASLAGSAAAIVRYTLHLRALFRLPDGIAGGSALSYANGADEARRWQGARSLEATGAPMAAAAVDEGGMGVGVDTVDTGGRVCGAAAAAAAGGCIELQPAAENGAWSGVHDGIGCCGRDARDGGGHGCHGRHWPDGSSLHLANAEPRPALGSLASCASAASSGGMAGAAATPLQFGVPALMRSATQGSRSVRAAVQDLRARVVHRRAGSAGGGKWGAYSRMAVASAEVGAGSGPGEGDGDGEGGAEEEGGWADASAGSCHGEGGGISARSSLSTGAHDARALEQGGTAERGASALCSDQAGAVRAAGLPSISSVTSSAAADAHAAVLGHLGPGPAPRPALRSGSSGIEPDDR